jgi:phosphoglycolate phosphatase
MTTQRIATTRLVCLDMAGTMVRDGGVVMAAFVAALQTVGLDGDRLDCAVRYAHLTMGMAKTDVFEHILGAGMSARAMAAFDRHLLGAIAAGQVAPIEGAADAAMALHSAGITVCLTTGFSPQVQEAILEHLGWMELCDFYLAPTSSLRGRPYPDMVLVAALRALVEDVRQIAVAGDTANDLWSGWRAGSSVVAGVLTGSHRREELVLAPHTHILGSVAELPALLL